MNLKSNLKGLLLIPVFSLITACGVEVVDHGSHSTEVVIVDPEISMTLYYEDSFGDRQFLTSKCLSTSDYGKRDSILVSNYDEGHELELRWRQGYSDLRLQVIEGGTFYYDSRFDYHHFEYGGEQKVEVEIDFTRYLLRLSGPSC